MFLHILTSSIRRLTTEQTALFGSWFTFGFTGIFGLHMDKGLWFVSPRKTIQTLLNIFSISVGVVLVSPFRVSSKITSIWLLKLSPVCSWPV